MIKLILKELQRLPKLTHLLNCGATIEFSLVVVLIRKRPAIGRRAIGRQLGFLAQPSSPALVFPRRTPVSAQCVPPAGGQRECLLDLRNSSQTLLLPSLRLSHGVLLALPHEKSPVTGERIWG